MKISQERLTYSDAVELCIIMNQVFEDNLKFSNDDIWECLQKAEQNEILRIIASAYRDKIIQKSGLFILNDSGINYKINEDMAFLLCNILKPHGLIKIFFKDKNKLLLINGIKDLFTHLKSFFEDLYGETTHAGWETLIYSAQQTIKHEAMALAYKKFWIKKIETQLNGELFWSWLFSLSVIKANQLLEQLGIFDSRSLNSYFKMKQQLTLEEAVKYSPEFGLDIPILMAALKKTNAKVYIENNNHQKLHHIISTAYPDTYYLWQRMLTTQKVDNEDYIPIFIHPLNLPLIKNIFHEYIDGENLIFNENVNIQTKATLSLRSMQPINGGPIIKLPIPVQTGHILRRIHIEELTLGIDFSQEIESLIKKSIYNYEKFHIIKDIAAASFFNDKQPNTHKAKEAINYFSFIIRESPLMHITSDEIVLPLATLFSAAPGSEKPLFIEIMEHAYQTQKISKREFVNNYLNSILGALLNLFIEYGLIPEAHQQNINVVFNKKSELIKFLYHDNVGGTAIFLPYFKYHVADERYNNIPFARSTPERPLLQFVHATLSAHIIPFINQLSRYPNFTREELLNIVNGIIKKYIEQGKNKIPKMDNVIKNVFSSMLKAFENEILKSKKFSTKRMLARLYLQSQTPEWGIAPNPFDLDTQAIPPSGTMDNPLRQK